MQRALPALGLLLLAGCASGPSVSTPVVSPEEFATIREGELVDALLVVDAVARRGDPTAAAWLLPVMRDTRYGHELRSGVAAGLMRLGFPEGQDFCLAVLQANVGTRSPIQTASGEEWPMVARSLSTFMEFTTWKNSDGASLSDWMHKLPSSDRWAFARELAYEAISERLRAGGIEPERYDVNFGAPDLLRATASLRKQLDALPELRPSKSPDELEAMLPESPPVGWPVSEYELWQRMRAEVISPRLFFSDEWRFSRAWIQ